MTWAAALFVVVAFVVLAQLLRVPARAARVIKHSRDAVADLRNSELSDLEKERAMQVHAKGLFVLFVFLTVSAATALAVPIGLIALLDAADLVELDAVLETGLSWEFLFVATIVGCGVFAFARSRSR